MLTCEGLCARGHDVTLITGPAIGPEGELLTRAQQGGYRVEVVNQLRREINPLRDGMAYRKIGQLLESICPDVMHSHSSKAGILARHAAAKAGRMKIVHTVHGLPFHPYERWWKNNVYIHLETKAARISNAIISVANAMTDQALTAGVGTADQYTTIYSGMEVEDFLNRPSQADEFRSSLNLPADAVLVTQVARLAELKGHEFLVTAAGAMEDSRVHFCFVGDGRLRPEIEAHIARLGLSDRFHLTGLLSPDRIPAVMHASDIVAHCSLREGLARAIPQAMLAGKPVISFNVDGAREAVNSETGILLPPGDVNGLRLSIETFADSPDLRNELGTNGRNRCREMFDHNVMVDQIEQLYEKLFKS